MERKVARLLSLQVYKFLRGRFISLIGAFSIDSKMKDTVREDLIKLRRMNTTSTLVLRNKITNCCAF